MALGTPNPKSLAVAALVGSYFVASIYFVSFLHLSRIALGGLFISFFVVGLGVSLPAEIRIKRGIRSGIWNDADLNAARRVLDHRAGLGLALGFTIMPLIVACVQWKFSHLILFYPLLFPLQTLFRLRQLVSPRNDKARLLHWDQAKPIQSEHWGDVASAAEPRN